MPETEWPFYLRFIVALALSFLIGLERERAGISTKGRVFAGVRTYTLIGIYGFGCGWLHEFGITWVLPVGVLSITALALAGYVAKLKEGHVGWTSEVAALVTFIIGALSFLADIRIPLALGIITAILLSEKSRIESIVEVLDKNEFLAVLKFLLVTLIILPVLPNEPYTRFNLNPRHIWEIVVLVSSVGFAGYFLSRKFGPRIGLRISGILGGIVSSTAVSITAGRIARRHPDRSREALKASLLASSVMYPRILVLILIIRPEVVGYIWWRMLILAGIGAVLALLVKSPPRSESKTAVQSPVNPFEIRPALIFAALFVFLSVVTVLIEEYYGNLGLLALSGVIGVTDIDPYILSLANQHGYLEAAIGTAMIAAMMSNTMVKGIYFGVQAKKSVGDAVWRYALWCVLHIPLIFLR